MENNRYVVIFILILTASVAVILTGLREVTKTQAELNEDIFNKRAILKAVENHLDGGKKVDDLTDEDVIKLFEEKVEQVVINREGTTLDGVLAEDIDMRKEKKKPAEEQQLPLFIYTEGGSAFYILSIRGNGLWDEIWGNVALESDLNTVTGASFDHQAETPGLGAEIKDNPSFPKQFEGKKIYDAAGEYVSISVKKGGAEDGNPHQVDGITGATVTSDGVTKMLYNGIKNYQPYLENLKGKKAPRVQGMLVE